MCNFTGVFRSQSSNRLIEYSFENAEKTVWSVVDLTVPLVTKLEDPINKIDDLMCKSLDIVVENVPIVTYTPEEVSDLWYMTDTQNNSNKNNWCGLNIIVKIDILVADVY